jgi:fermentation-respiration switch protein FrsA (DUF1100 family)
VLWLRWTEPHMLYHPARQIDQTPNQLGFTYEDVTLTASDGVHINGWFLPGARDPKLTVLFFHGNAGNISHRFEKFGIFHDLGVDTFSIDYRGYGRSEGQPNEEGTYRDALAAYEYLTQQRHISPDRLVVYGESLGAAIAADLASEVEVRGLVLEEGFTSVADVGQGMFPFLPVRWFVRNKYDTLGKMPRIKVPLLILHSRDDEFFNMRHAERLLAAANEPKQLVELRGRHNEAFLTSATIYHDALHKFFVALKPQ